MNVLILDLTPILHLSYQENEPSKDLIPSLFTPSTLGTAALFLLSKHPMRNATLWRTMMSRINSFQTDDILTVSGQNYHYFSLKKLEQAGLKSVHLLPKTLKILLEQLLRNEDGARITRDDISTLANWAVKPTSTNLLFSPARVLMQDFTGVPAIVDLAAMRAAMVSRGGDPQ